MAVERKHDDLTFQGTAIAGEFAAARAGGAVQRASERNYGTLAGFDVNKLKALIVSKDDRFGIRSPSQPVERRPDRSRFVAQQAARSATEIHYAEFCNAVVERTDECKQTSIR